MAPDTLMVGCADDIAAVIVAQTTEETYEFRASRKRSLNQVMNRASSWLEEHDLDLSIEKTEIVLLTG